MTTKTKIYVGAGENRLREVFRSKTTPTRESHGHLYLASIGPSVPFGEPKAMIHFGTSNPHIVDVTDAERIGKKYAEQLKDLPTKKGGPHGEEVQLQDSSARG